MLPSAVNISNCNTNVLEILRFRMNQGRKLISCCDSSYTALRTQAIHSLKTEREVNANCTEYLMALGRIYYF